jgi:large subunit ribosomal protein L29
LLIRCLLSADLLSEDIHSKVADKRQNEALVKGKNQMKAQQYREMNAEELKDKLDEMQRHLFDLRSQAVTEKLENSKALINVRRDIARIKTIMRESR